MLEKRFSKPLSNLVQIMLYLSRTLQVSLYTTAFEISTWKSFQDKNCWNTPVLQARTTRTLQHMSH